MKGCYNCNQSGHMSRECPEPRKDTRGGRGGGGSFNSGGGDRNSGFRSSTNGGNTFRNTRNQNDNDNSESKPSFPGWRGGAATVTNNDSDEANKRPAFGSSTTRGGFSNSGSGFRGKYVFQLSYEK